MKLEAALKLEKVVERIVESYIKDYNNISDNFYKVKCDIYPSNYGLNCHITLLFEKPFSRNESDFIHTIMSTSGIKKRVDNSLGNIFDGGVHHSQSTIDSYEGTSQWYDLQKQRLQ
jgi:hypothetical protein